MLPTSPPLTARLDALGDPLRLRILGLLSRVELGVGEVVRVVGEPQATVSRHLKVLHAAGWAQLRRAGATSLYTLDPAALPPGSQPLWDAISAQLGAEGPTAEDLARLDEVLAVRTADAAGFFARWADRWDALKREVYGDAFWAPALLALLPRGTRVADLGCGTGELVAALAAAGAEVIGVDREEAMLTAARGRTEGLPGVTLLRGDVEALPIPDASVDAALLVLVLQHLAQPAAALAEAARVLRPGGRLIALDLAPHHNDGLQAVLGHTHRGFSARDLAALGDGAGLALAHHARWATPPGALAPALVLAVWERVPAAR